jgi:hypothetical protein
MLILRRVKNRAAKVSLRFGRLVEIGMFRDSGPERENVFQRVVMSSIIIGVYGEGWVMCHLPLRGFNERGIKAYTEVGEVCYWRLG